MSQKQEATISITGIPEEQAHLLSIMLGEFLEFTGFDVTLSMASDPSDEELSATYENFVDNLQVCIDNTKINISS